MPNLGESLLPVAAVFGPNASGKSNVIAALTWLRGAVADSLRFWEDRIPVERFAFSGGPQRPSEGVLPRAEAAQGAAGPPDGAGGPSLRHGATRLGALAEFAGSSSGLHALLTAIERLTP
ncbi:AAA family ATPase [Micromonospora sp. DT233]|uniref:AAA family ATPase n=1 Tax=Micromonospora sp. DT233 TaxID=3393432 RepID=UPI003CF6379A